MMKEDWNMLYRGLLFLEPPRQRTSPVDLVKEKTRKCSTKLSDASGKIIQSPSESSKMAHTPVFE